MALKEVGVKLVVEGVDKFKSSLGDAKTSIGGLGDQLKSAAPALRNVGLAMTGAAAGIGIASLKMAADFEGAMREVNTMMGLGEDEFQNLSDQVLQTAKDVGKAPEEMAKALYQVVSAGVPAADALDVLRTSAEAAIGGVTDTTTAVDGITTVLNAFHMSAGEADSVASTMFETVKRGKTTFEELSSNLSNVAGPAANLGVSFDVVAGALATMTKQGIPTAQATTQLRQAMVALAKPTESMKKALKNLGYESGRALLESKGLAGGLDLLREEAGGSDEELANMFGSVEALNSVLALTGQNAETFQDDLKGTAKAAKEATGATDAYNEMNKGAARQYEQLMVQVQALAITIGDALMPALTAIFDAVGPIIKVMADWISQNPELTAAIIGIVGVLGGLALVLGTVVPAVSSVITVIGFAAGGFGAVLGLLLSPIGLVVAAVAGLALAAYLIYDNWEAIAGFFSDLWDSVYNIFKKYWEWILLVIFPAVGLPVLIWQNWGAITEIVSDIWDAVVGFFRDNWQLILGIIFPAYGLYQLVEANWGKITGAVSAIWDKVVSLFRDNWQLILGIIFPPYGLYQMVTDNWGKITGAVSSIVESVTGLWSGMWNGIKAISDAIGNGLSSAFQKYFFFLTSEWGWFQNGLIHVENAWKTMWNAMSAAVKVPVNAIIGFINIMIGALESAINAIARGLNAIPDVNIPSWVPGIGGNSFGIPYVNSVSFGRIPKLYAGGNILEGGLAMVGERGPEIVSLPAGATVSPISNTYNITENYARPDSPQSLNLTLQALAMYART